MTIERTVVRWLAEAAGCEGFTGSLAGGGSSVNLMGLAMAREAKAPANEDGARPGAVYASAEVHMSVPKALALLGTGRANLRLIPVDDAFRMRADLLEAAIEQDRRAGIGAIAIVATAGTTNTGAIDPLAEIAGIARAHDLWLHVDGAYGGLAALAVPGLFAGLSQADSIALDAHKWLYQPVDCSALLYRDAGAARRAFAYTGEYARSLSDDPVEGFEFFAESLELSRRFRALKLWLSLRYHGFGQFREAIREDLRHAQLLARLIAAEPALELLAPVELSTVCFRWKAAGRGTRTSATPRFCARYPAAAACACPTPASAAHLPSARASSTTARPTPTSPPSCRKSWPPQPPPPDRDLPARTDRLRRTCRFWERNGSGTSCVKRLAGWLAGAIAA